MRRFVTHDAPLAGLKRIEHLPLIDARGAFTRLFCIEELAAAGWSGAIAQINHTHTTRRGTVRGLHFQHPPHAETKLVSCLRGEVFDVAVDLRPDSPTWLHWHGVILSGENHCALLIPPGFAHGFQTLTDQVEMLYCHSAAYSPQAEGGVHPQDPRVGVRWPLAVVEMSERDAQHPRIGAEFKGVKI